MILTLVPVPFSPEILIKMQNVLAELIFLVVLAIYYNPVFGYFYIFISIY
jgi:hypothetical protein